MNATPPPSAAALATLRAHLGAFDARAHRPADPVHLVHRYRSGADQEIAAFLASMLAFGRVASIQQNVSKLLAILGKRPAQGVRAFDVKSGQDELGPWVHRWCSADDGQPTCNLTNGGRIEVARRISAACEIRK